ncbi:unnamed protein product [Urochloa decumbens]|uniref:F-box domain-containing protein n=1 Tax=Urochloa decumbens TaxID=240449 RepID=A0ABC9EE80_9POAL
MTRGKANIHLSAQAISHGAKDRLSNLPDDILLTILERLDIRDTARTSLLSRQWRQMPTMLNKLVIKVSTFEPKKDERSEITLDDLARANATMHEATKNILSGRRNFRQYPLHLLCLEFYLGDESNSIVQTVGCTMDTLMVGEVEFTILTKKEQAHCSEDDVVLYGQQLMSLFKVCPNAFGGLTRLKLENVSLNEPDLPIIFSVCQRLEFLRLDNCDTGILSSLEVEHPRLGELEMDDCRFDRVHLKWLPKLTMLTFGMWISQQDPLSFGYVPLLKSLSVANICLSYHKMLKLSDFLDNVTISSLQLNFKSEKIWVLPEGPKELLPVFRKLRVVDLVNISEECDLNWTLFILQGAPFLEELHITVRDHFCEMMMDEELRAQYAYSKEKKGVDWEGANGFKHHKLVVLKIFGFRPEDMFVRYVRSVIKAAVNLKDVFLFNKVVCEMCKHDVPKASRSPWPKKQRFSLRNRITSGTDSFVVIHFPNLSSN